MVLITLRRLYLERVSIRFLGREVKAPVIAPHEIALRILKRDLVDQCETELPADCIGRRILHRRKGMEKRCLPPDLAIARETSSSNDVDAPFRRLTETARSEFFVMLILRSGGPNGCL